MNTPSRIVKCFASLMLASGLCVTGLNATIYAQAHASETTIELGQSITLTSIAYATNQDLVALSGYVRGPGSFSPPNWSGWSQILSVGFGATYANNTSVTFTPTSTGTYQFHANGYSSSEGWAGTDIGNWASWDTWSDTPAVAATFTVVAPSVSARARTSNYIAVVGQPITLYADARAADGSLVALSGYLRGPGTYSAPDWSGWSQIISVGFSATTSASTSTTFTPTAAGNYQFHANGYSTTYGWAGTDIGQWASWNTFSWAPAIAATLTVLPDIPYAGADILYTNGDYNVSASIHLGESVLILGRGYTEGDLFGKGYTSGDPAGLTRLTGWIRGPGSYTTSSPWTGWSMLFDDTFGARGSYFKYTSFTPTAVGTYQVHINAYSNGTWAGTDIYHWAGWNDYSSERVVVASFTVLPP
ncbi:MAG TPA: hypothetical protein VG734_10635 [Lacunisphaera sp.]|nr:hypothetical protein [Lacunisphaera sp.]